MIQEQTRCDWCEQQATNTRTGERLCDQHTKEVDECRDLAIHLKDYLEPSIVEWSLAKLGEGYQSWQTYDAVQTVGELLQKGAWAISKEVATRQGAELDRFAEEGESFMQQKSQEKFVTHITIEGLNVVAVVPVFSHVHKLLGNPDTDSVTADLNLIYDLTDDEIETIKYFLGSAFQSFSLHKMEEREYD